LGEDIGAKTSYPTLNIKKSQSAHNDRLGHSKINRRYSTQRLDLCSQQIVDPTDDEKTQSGDTKSSANRGWIAKGPCSSHGDSGHPRGLPLDLRLNKLQQ
jgi:hypothetical protein